MIGRARRIRLPGVRIAALLGLGQVLLAAPASGQSAGAITGTVTDRATGQPLADVAIIVDGGTRGAVTDTAGFYRVREVRSGWRRLRAQRIGYRPVVADSVFSTHKARLFDLSRRHRLPTMSNQDDYAKAGCLMSYAANRTDLYRRAATYVDKILRGAKPADLPVEQPTKFDLAINLKTANTLGLTIPPSVLARADEVIQ